MARIILHFMLIVATLLLLAGSLPGFYVDGWRSAILAALLLGFLNAIVRPFLAILTLPLLILTLGLFWFVLNAFLLIVVAFLVPGFSFNGFMPALIASLVLSAVNLLWKAATERKETREER